MKKRFRTQHGLAAVACLAVSSQVSAQSIALVNGSFEDPDIPQANLSLIDFSQINSQLEFEFAIGRLLSVDFFGSGWTQTGPTSNFTNPPNQQTGVFSNQSVVVNSPQFNVQIDPIENVDGDGVGFDQLGFILADPFADGVLNDFVSIHQASAGVFEADTEYRFTLAVGLSSVFPAGDDAPLRIAIGYLDDTPGLEGSEKFIELDGLDIIASDLGPGTGTSGPTPLEDFWVDLTPDEIAPELLGKTIAVEIRVDVPSDVPVQDRFNIGGSFNFDNARLTVVPEPTSLALLGLGGLLALRRRR
ncbi:MAG: PEP-CTERM sorting domain-containing protein [Planctomycetota bacterium]